MKSALFYSFAKIAFLQGYFLVVSLLILPKAVLYQSEYLKIWYC